MNSSRSVTGEPLKGPDGGLLSDSLDKAAARFALSSRITMEIMIMTNQNTPSGLTAAMWQ